MIYLTLAELLYAGERRLGHDYAVRAYCLLEAATARARATLFGNDAYPALDAKAAARRSLPPWGLPPASRASEFNA